MILNQEGLKAQIAQKMNKLIEQIVHQTKEIAYSKKVDAGDISHTDWIL